MQQQTARRTVPISRRVASAVKSRKRPEQRDSDHPLRNITRFDYRKYHGWRVMFCRNGRYHVQYFSDASYGGKGEALAKAIAYRDAMEKKLPVLKTCGGLARPVGHGYVRKITRYYQRTDGTWVAQRCWKAWVKISKAGAAAATHYSIPRWGMLAAHEKATTWLKMKQAQVKELPG